MKKAMTFVGVIITSIIVFAVCWAALAYALRGSLGYGLVIRVGEGSADLAMIGITVISTALMHASATMLLNKCR